MTELDSIEAALDEAALEAGVSREEVLKRALVALAEANDVDVPDSERVDKVAADVDELQDDLDEHVADLRDRVVQVLHEVDGKAAADHSHPALASTLDDVAADVDAIDERTAALSDRVRTLEERLDEDLSEKLSTVAGAVVRLQRRLGSLEAAHAERETLADLLRAANRLGVRKADCANCEHTVRLALLPTPTCPHCESRFGGVEPKSGFFGNATLTIGDPPALEGDVAPESGTELFEDE